MIMIIALDMNYSFQSARWYTNNRVADDDVFGVGSELLPKLPCTF